MGLHVFDAPGCIVVPYGNRQSRGSRKKILTENGYMNRVTEVIAVNIKDEVGGLNTVL